MNAQTQIQNPTLPNTQLAQVIDLGNGIVSRDSVNRWPEVKSLDHRAARLHSANIAETVTIREDVLYRTESAYFSALGRLPQESRDVIKAKESGGKGKITTSHVWQEGEVPLHARLSEVSDHVFALRKLGAIDGERGEKITLTGHLAAEVEMVAKRIDAKQQ